MTPSTSLNVKRTAPKKTPVKPAPKKLIEAKRGIILDLGCGEQKQPGSVGMDKQDRPGVDIVHDWNDFPWPFEDESVLTIVASHVVEHVNPVDGHFLRWMDECHRILKTGRQMAIIAPYGTNNLYARDPTHCNPVTEQTFWYFCPTHGSSLYQFYRPLPWYQEISTFHSAGVLEVVLRKLPNDPSKWTDPGIPGPNGPRP